MHSQKTAGWQPANAANAANGQLVGREYDRLRPKQLLKHTLRWVHDLALAALLGDRETAERWGRTQSKQ